MAKAKHFLNIILHLLLMYSNVIMHRICSLNNNTLTCIVSEILNGFLGGHKWRMFAVGASENDTNWMGSSNGHKAEAAGISLSILTQEAALCPQASVT